MKNNYSIAQRNQIVEAHLRCVEQLMQEKGEVITAEHLDKDDVYQQLATRLILAVSGFDPDKSTLRQHIFAQLRHEFEKCRSPYRKHGLTGVPNGHTSNIISLDSVRNAEAPVPALMAA
jgi:hypothetical protein